MTNWKKIHPRFTAELSQQWLDKDFTFEKTKEWIEANLTPKDAGFANYLEGKGYSAQEILNYDLASLKEDYLNNRKERGKEKIETGEEEKKQYLPFIKDDKKVDEKELRLVSLLSDFENDLETRTRWWEKGISYKDAQDWIKAGLMFDEEGLAAYINKEKGHRYAYSIPRDILLEWKIEYEETEEYQLNRAIAMSLETTQSTPRIEIVPKR